jgi:hypothetical protein
MSKAMFARVQLLLEETQEKIAASEEKWQTVERQIRGLHQRVQTLEGHIALMRAKSQETLERAGKTNGDHGNSGH